MLRKIWILSFQSVLESRWRRSVERGWKRSWRGCFFSFLSVGKARRNRRESREYTKVERDLATYTSSLSRLCPIPYARLFVFPPCLTDVWCSRPVKTCRLPIRNRTDSSRPFLWMADTRSRLADGSCLSLPPTFQISNGLSEAWRGSRFNDLYYCSPIIHRPSRIGLDRALYYFFSPNILSRSHTCFIKFPKFF